MKQQSKSTKIPRTSIELEQELNDQLRLLLLDAKNYDSGEEIAAKGMATKLRVLCHDTKSSHSLLGQTGKLDTLFHDTAQEIDNTSFLTYSGLITVNSEPSGARYEAPLDCLPQGSANQRPFNEWWNSTVFIDKEENKFSRKDLVLSLANQDGGAHVDPQLDEKYHKLSRQNSLGWQARMGEEPWKPLTNPHYVAIRQIAHEVLKTFTPGYAAHPASGNGIKIAGSAMGINPPPPPPSERARKTSARHARCSCGSGKKFKNCHGKSS